MVNNMIIIIFCQGTTSGDPRTKSETAGSKLNLQIHENERNYSFPGKKDGKSSIFSPLGDDLDITGNDDMTKVCELYLLFVNGKRKKVMLC